MEDRGIVHGQCTWSADLSNWLPHFFSLRESKVGGLEMAYFQDEAMTRLAGIMVTLDLKVVNIVPFPQHPHTLIFTTRRGRQFAFSFDTKELMLGVAELLPLAIDGVEQKPKPDDQNETQVPRKRLRNTISLERCPTSVSSRGKVPPPKPNTPKPLRKAPKANPAAENSVPLSRKESGPESIYESAGAVMDSHKDDEAPPLTKTESRPATPTKEGLGATLTKARSRGSLLIKDVRGLKLTKKESRGSLKLTKKDSQGSLAKEGGGAMLSSQGRSTTRTRDGHGASLSMCFRPLLSKRAFSISVAPPASLGQCGRSSSSPGVGSSSSVGSSTSGDSCSVGSATSGQTSVDGALFRVDSVTAELSPAAGTLSVWAEDKERFHADILPYLDALPIDNETFCTSVSFSQLAETFIQRNWALTTCSIDGDVIKCTFTTRWGERILERIKHLDDTNSKKDLMKCLHVLRLSLDLNVMA